MLKRKIYSELLLWKKQRREDKLKKCLLIKGARQVGKSYILNAFGRNEYKSLNFQYKLHSKLLGWSSGLLF